MEKKKKKNALRLPNRHFTRKYNVNWFCIFAESVINYIAPRADTEFEDVSYDGDLGRTYMTGGLGMLTDSLYGADDFLQFDLQFHKPLSKCDYSLVFSIM